MSEQNPQQSTTTRLTASGITIELDLREVLTAIDPQGRYRGYNPDQDEPVYEPSSLEHRIVDATAALLIQSLRKDVKDLVAIETAGAIKAQIETIIREIMDAPVQQVSDWGTPTGEVTPLRELIGKQAEKALKMPELREGYTRGQQPTMVQRIIASEMDKAFRAEVKGVIDQARKDTLAAVQAEASAVIAEAVRRATPGL